MITVRYGGRLDVVPQTRSGGWRVTGYPAGILRLLGSPADAESHSFTAIAVGTGEITLVADREPDTFTVRVRVIRDLTRHPRP